MSKPTTPPDFSYIHDRAGGPTWNEGTLQVGFPYRVGPWEVDVDLDGASGELVGLTIRADLSTPITTRNLQRLPLGRLHRKLLVLFAEKFTEYAGALELEGPDRAAADEVVARLESRRKPGPKGLSDTSKAELAQAYVDEVVTGGRSMVDFARSQNYNPQTISNRIAALRRDGFLTKSERQHPGRAYGAPTDKTRALLEGDTDGAR